MKHIKKFEDLDYSTYASAADKLYKHGQKNRAQKIKTHAEEIELSKIREMKFDILVGETRTYNDATFDKLAVIREKNAMGILCYFNSKPNNTHRILATINEDGKVVWRDYNKFANRKSVNDYQKMLKKIATFHAEFKDLLEDMELTPDQISVSSRTFYI